jgi:hypothetical protein
VAVPLDDLARLFDEQARTCERERSPAYAELLDRSAADLRAGGLLADLLAPYAAAATGEAVPLRLMGALHRLVLERAAPRLAVQWPSVGGSWAGAGAAWPAVLDALQANRARVSVLLRQVPQTNEVGRAAALAGLLRHAAAQTGRRRVRLVELGASGGLNLLVDRFHVTGAGASAWGPAESPVQLAGAWEGAAPPEAAVEVVERTGYDLQPVDVTTTEGRLLLTSYVWADQRERLERLRGALSVAAEDPPRVLRAGAADALAGLRPRPDELLVVWHSVMWQYVEESERVRLRAGLDELVGAGGVHACLEPRDAPPGTPRSHDAVLRVGDAPARVLGSAPPHGVPVVWTP